MINFKEIKNIIFDIGDVLLTINKLEAQKALLNLSISGENLTQMLLKETGDYFRYEQGELTTDEFRNCFRKVAKRPLTDEEIDKAWCAMLGEFPADRINWLKQLSKKYNTFILSNTNALHIQAFNRMLKADYNISSLDEIVQKAYYSNEILLRKPDIKIYEYVLNDSLLKPQESLFLDDREENLEAAEKTGIKTFLVTKQTKFGEIFKNA